MLKVTMPGLVDAMLRHCPDRTAEEIWAWLDSTPDAVEQMIQTVVDGHPKVAAKNERMKKEA